MNAQPSGEAVALVTAALRAEGVLAIAVWQGIDFSIEQAHGDLASEAVWQYIAALEADRDRLAFVVDYGYLSALRRYQDGTWTLESDDGDHEGEGYRGAIDAAMQVEV